MDTIQGAGKVRPQHFQKSWADALPWTITVFFSAALIFLVQPMYAKMATPLLGGAPSVWNVSLVCFQAALLGGYAYAHLLAHLRSIRLQVIIHGVLLCLAALALPLSISGMFGSPDSEHPILWLTATFLVSIAPPFAILSATAPLTQYWYSKSGQPDARDPYHLYSASNAGSLLGLLVYPIVMEPFTTLGTQTLLWSGGYGMVAFLLIACGLMVIFQEKADLAPASQEASLPKKVSWREKAYWLVLSAVPSGLLLGATSHISTDIASAPFLWAPPLIAYISTFIIVFARKPLINPKAAEKYLLLVIAAALLSLNLPIHTPIVALVGIALHVGALFMAALCLHGTLVARRPEVSGLTEFYLFMSLGGVLGAAFVALVAPVIFNDIYEYPLLLGLALLLTPRFSQTRHGSLFNRKSAPILALIVIAILAAAGFTTFRQSQSANITKRGFFGVVSTYMENTDRPIMYLRHGSTVHGAQLKDEVDRPTPITYYHEAGPIGQAFHLMSQRATHIGVVGLGAGSVACHAQPSQQFTYYEIDPLVVDIATNPDYFTYLSTCTPDADIHLGDARITLTSAPPQGYDLLLLDAFSSDAIPVHLLTREAMQLYLSRLSDNGVMVFHISNRYVDLVPVLARVGAAENAVMMWQSYSPSESEAAAYANLTKAMVFAKSEAALGPFLADERWKPIEADDKRPWTDDYSNLIGALIDKH
ncbi:spermidine synthase [Hyphomonas pacifica]|uniref:PABS domain-containing protein n=2 Tax=Hyphomonas pacifica TaxID=1280941 RepID=A0A062TZJ4_9PROT|nr:fused MFS/spermidine synthase [Hyphomonas pacifica]KCZ50913.1 hypothetical protein HY2_12965 [Hyphomonas pacifica]RAN33454.1 hypothetical protein HY3_12955 [Hyphomonas pacifica]